MSAVVIGLTGGVASGKSAATTRFQTLGVDVADADLAAREAVAIGSPGLTEVVAAFGTGILQADGSLNRAALRRRVFADPSARRHLEALLHPRVRVLLRQQCAQARSPYAVAAIPLLAEGGGRAGYPWLRRILVIDVPLRLQRQRLMQRDQADATLADAMIAAQASREQRLAIADDVIVNDSDLDALHRQVDALHRRYLTLAHSTGH